MVSHCMSILSTPNIHHSRGVFTIYATTDILAAPEMVFAVLSDFRDYDRWNTFTPKVEALSDKDNSDLSPGDEIRLEAQIRGMSICVLCC